MIRNYQVTYSYSRNPYMVMDSIAQSIRSGMFRDGIIHFLNEQQANYVFHICPKHGQIPHTRVYVSVEEEYMAMFYLTSDLVFPMISDEQLARDLAP